MSLPYRHCEGAQHCIVDPCSRCGANRWVGMLQGKVKTRPQAESHKREESVVRGRRLQLIYGCSTSYKRLGPTCSPVGGGIMLTVPCRVSSPNNAKLLVDPNDEVLGTRTKRVL